MDLRGGGRTKLSGDRNPWKEKSKLREAFGIVNKTSFGDPKDPTKRSFPYEII